MITGGSDPRSPVAVTARVWVRGSLAGGSDPVHGGRWVPDRERCRPFRVGPRDDGRWPARPASGERVRQDLADIAHPPCTEASPHRVTGNQARTRFVAAWQPDHVPPPCGKPTCRCAAGEPHQSPALACTVGGATKTLTWPMPTCPRWSRRLARFGAARAELERAADAWHGSVARPPGPVNGLAAKYVERAPFLVASVG